ncbi:MAG: ribbon-helix-helix domain-containing protein [Halohasta sp.]
MEYANVSVKFPVELDRELEAFLDETGVYTNKSEFIKESVRRHLIDLNNDPTIAALRVEQLLGRAEQTTISDDDLHDRLDELRQQVDAAAVEQAVETAREETAAEHADHA